MAMNRERLDELAEVVKAAVEIAVAGASAEFVLLVVEKAPNPDDAARSKVHTLSTLDHRQLVGVLCRVAEARISTGLQNRQMGNALSALPDSTKERMFELLAGIMSGSEQYADIPAAAWRDLMLIWSASTAHDGGLGEHDWLGAAIETAEEEWSTPATAARAAVTELLEKTKPAG